MGLCRSATLIDTWVVNSGFILFALSFFPHPGTGRSERANFHGKQHFPVNSKRIDNAARSFQKNLSAQLFRKCSSLEKEDPKEKPTTFPIPRSLHFHIGKQKVTK